MLLSAKDPLLIISHTKNSSTSIRNFCQQNGIIDITGNLPYDQMDRFPLRLCFTQDPVTRYFKGLVEYGYYNNLDYELKDLIHGLFSHHGCDLKPIIIEHIKDWTDNFTNLCVDDHTNTIFNETWFEKLREFGLLYIDYRYCHHLVDVCKWLDFELLTTFSPSEFPHENRSPEYKRFLYDQLYAIYETYPEIQKIINDYLEPDISEYNKLTVLKGDSIVRPKLKEYVYQWKIPTATLN